MNLATSHEQQQETTGLAGGFPKLSLPVVDGEAVSGCRVVTGSRRMWRRENPKLARGKEKSQQPFVANLLGSSGANVACQSWPTKSSADGTLMSPTPHLLAGGSHSGKNTGLDENHVRGRIQGCRP